MNKELLNKIKTELPKGALTEIKEKAGTSYVTVLNFFKGKTSNGKVLNATNEVYGNYKKTMNELYSARDKKVIC